jgi:hypothetical protein
MAPPKKTWTAEVAKASNNSQMTDHFKRMRKGRPKKCAGNLPGDVIVVTKKKPGPAPQPKKPPTSVAKKRGAAEEVPKVSDC